MSLNERTAKSRTSRYIKEINKEEEDKWIEERIVISQK
jgi:hypothetical protein